MPRSVTESIVAITKTLVELNLQTAKLAGPLVPPTGLESSVPSADAVSDILKWIAEDAKGRAYTKTYPAYENMDRAKVTEYLLTIVESDSKVRDQQLAKLTEIYEMLAIVMAGLKGLGVP